MVGKQSLWLANHPRCRQPCHFPCSRFQTSDVRHNARDNEQNRTLSCKKGSFQSSKSSDSTAKVISISSSECDGSFQELSSRQSSRSNQILTVMGMASLRGRSCEICVTRASQVEVYIWPSTHDVTFT